MASRPRPLVSTAVVPISFTDVPLDVAIQALAREAGINYLLDPAIGWGQPDQTGQNPTATDVVGAMGRSHP